MYPSEIQRAFLVLFDHLPIRREDVKQGTNDPKVVTAARTINVALFLSNSIRRDVTISIAIVSNKSWKIISFPGNALRRVSPDERSIAFFLLKAVDALEKLEEGEICTLDNGIMIERVAVEDFLSRWNHVYIASTNASNEPFKPQPGSIYVYDMNTCDIRLEKPKYVSRARTPERFILDINLAYDNIE